jgi:hypothetical protein
MGLEVGLQGQIFESLEVVVLVDEDESKFDKVESGLSISQVVELTRERSGNGGRVTPEVTTGLGNRR